ncbi:uncharacterized protein LOC105834211 [Monomorium pharaonis]|uniref:uncharacterized protein LOC105834211 n=1 Tax=Monomorium pharaonis TaxID=307658 RepID=UPI001747B58C|nr:uncharacterized protein LOC105834211 [Monomorium pharaonis]
MADNEGNSTEPPVPPRRTKRKNKIAPVKLPVANNGATETINDHVVISQQKCPPPPPQPPPPLEKCRRNNFGYVEIGQPQCDTTASCPRTENGVQRHPESHRINDTVTSTRDSSTSSNGASGDPIARSTVSKPFPSSRYVASSNKYPSLLFTLRDFENVVFDTWNRNDSVDPKQNLREVESKAHTLDDNDDVCFRVTTTNLPFEKCLGKWRDPFNDYRFESSVDENNWITNERSSGCDTFDDDSKCRAGTKVRFAIESPSSSPSKRDVKISVPCDKQNAASSVKPTEIREEFANAENRRDHNTRDKSYMSGVERENFGEDDPFITAGANEVDAKLKTTPQAHRGDRNNDVNCEKIRVEDSHLISRGVRIDDETLETGREDIITSVTSGRAITSGGYDAKQVDQSKNASSGVAGDAHRFASKSLETACRIDEATKITRGRAHREEEMFIKKTSDDIKEKCVAENDGVFYNESAENFLNERQDDGTSGNIFTEDLVNKSVENEQQTRRLPEENREGNDSFVNSKNKYETASSSADIFAKNIPVKVRRDSFLETMLSDDLADTSMNCAMISATISSSMDVELNVTNKSPHKIQKLDIAKNKQSLNDSCNSIKIDAKSQKILKSSKKTEERIKISSVKSTQLENKSASDMKNDVLNELLCNFNNIKLKIVSPENKKLPAKIDGDENICRPSSIGDGIFRQKENTSKSFGKNEICSVPASTKITEVYNDTMTVEKIVKKEDLVKIKIEKMPQDLKNGITLVSEKVTKSLNTEIKKPDESFGTIKNKIARDNSETNIDNSSSDIKTEEINVKRIEETSVGTKSAVETNQESRKSRDVRVPKTILKKTNVRCERRQANECQKRIPIGAPATMNKIFDSREFRATADDTSRNKSLENGRRRERASRKIHTRGEEKTDEVIADEADDDRGSIASQSALALLDDTMSSDDKCAIARKTTSVNYPCNNNDNNRPVANVSNDQSFRDVVTITPGKVRSFVKYYEIRCDATTVERHSKINDREKVARCKFTKSHAMPARSWQRPEVMAKEKKTNGGEGSVKSNDCDPPETLFNKAHPSTFAPRVPEDPPKNPVRKTTEMGLKIKEYEKNGLHISDKETTRAPFTKTNAKKSVQFLGGFTVIHSETFGEDESARTAADRDTNTLRKRRAPGTPTSQDSDDYRELVRETAKSEKPPDVKEGSSQRREGVTQILAVADHVQNSGINHFVLKPETPQLVFYCTI